MPETRDDQARETATVRVENVAKTFPGQQALKGVSLSLERGRVRALLGENGSGKSTLIKVMAGYHHPDPGWRAWVEGEPFNLGSAADARAAGLRFIHQDLGLVSELSVVDNLALGESYVGRRWLSRRREAAEAERLLAGYGVELDVSAPLGSLSPAERTIVAVVRALRDGMDRAMLVLDEPTASLSGPEVARLFEVIRAVRDKGGALLYVTHRLQEVFEIADTVTVLRDGHEIASRSVAGLDQDQLVEMLVGRAVSSVFPSPPPVGREVAMSVRGVSGERVTDVDFDVHRSEILGFAGIIGSGREELPYLLYGARPWRQGRIEILGAGSSEETSIRKSLANGVAFAAADRQRDSAIPELRVRENLTLPSIPRTDFGWWLSPRQERSEAREWLEKLDVRPADPERPLASLSGGNQQRVVLARWLRCNPKVLLLEEPTRGVDIAAKAEIYKLIGEAARQGMACVVFSADAEELAAICDRVLILRDGSLSGELSGSGLSEDAIVEQSIMERKVVEI